MSLQSSVSYSLLVKETTDARNCPTTTDVRQHAAISKRYLATLMHPEQQQLFVVTKLRRRIFCALDPISSSMNTLTKFPNLFETQLLLFILLQYAQIGITSNFELPFLALA